MMGSLRAVARGTIVRSTVCHEPHCTPHRFTNSAGVELDVHVHVLKYGRVFMCIGVCTCTKNYFCRHELWLGYTV